MIKYYTRACNFYYGSRSKNLVKRKKELTLNGKKENYFNKVKIIKRKTKKNNYS